MRCIAKSWLFLTAPLIFFLLLIASGPAPAGEALLLSRDDLSYNLSEHLDVLPDPRQNLNISQVSSASLAGGFKPNLEATLKLGGPKKSVYWLRCKLLMSSPPPPGDAWLLEFGVSYLRRVTLFMPQEKLGWTVTDTAGLSGPKPQRMGLRHAVFPLPPDIAAHRYCYIRLELNTAVQTTVMIWSQRDLWSRSLKAFLGFGASYGILITMIIVNMGMFFSLRDRVYFHYVLYIAAMLLFNFAVFGQLRIFVELSAKAEIAVILFLVSAVVFFAANLNRSFLLTRARTPRWDRVVLALMYLAVAAGGAALAGWLQASGIMAHVLGVGAPLIGIAVWIRCMGLGFKPSKYFLMAWCIFAAGSICWDLRWLGIFPVYTWSDYGFAIGTSLESILLSLALAQRVRMLRREKEALALSERRYHKLSLTDGLTGLLNKSFFQSKLAGEAEHALRMNLPLSLAMLDVDGFKPYNDSYGHPAGDQLLMTLARLMKHSTRQEDFCCRFGGDEFAVILPGTGLEQALTVCERIRGSFAHSSNDHRSGSRAQVTLSVGLAFLAPGEKAPDILRRADAALYRAKKQGRNRTEVSNPDSAKASAA